MSGKVEGKTVMITGAGTGFGSQLAIRAAQEGARRVIVHYPAAYILARRNFRFKSAILWPRTCDL